MSELKPCPFCGGEATETIAGVSCTGCGGTMYGGVQYGGSGWADVIKAWNTRAEPEIVRCRDCVWYSEHMWVVATDVADVCEFWHGEPTKVEPDGFCKWGERRRR